PYLWTIYRFLWNLNSIAANQKYKDTDVLTFTVFVQENHYENNWNDRMVKSHATNGKSGELHWSEFVNVDDRKVMLFPDTKVSDDGASTFSNPRRVFAQRSIRTIYKPRFDKSYKAWGTESKEEFFHNTVNAGDSYPAWFTKLGGKTENWHQVQRMLPIAKLDDNGTKKYLERVEKMGSTTSDHGREACFDELEGKSWETYLNYGNKPLNYETGKPGDMNYRLSGHLYLNDNGITKENMIAACLARNRDLDGNGTIDANEIRWYVPGIRQLQALFVGNAGLPVEARLYQKEANEGKWIYKHYMSATRKAGDASNSILWAEEGISTGPMNKSYAYGVHVRCVRDLGTDLSQRADTWSDSYKIFKTQTGSVGGYIEIDNFNDNSVRFALENKDLSGVITTFSNSNRPAKSFYYANKIINVGPKKTFIYNSKEVEVPDWESGQLIRIGDENKKSETSPQRRSLCGEHFGQGWRTPTITELAILYWSNVFKRTDEVMSRTRYTFWNKNGATVYGTDIITGKSNDRNGRDPHSFCSNEFRLRIPWENVKTPDSSQWEQVAGHYGGILCVKDKF
ncbi:MAG: hypothetical protein K2G90_09725, partial [Muribaculaceae bacterium]|nr:hypothetical protein [Muribaculaceae bacterium]